MHTRVNITAVDNMSAFGPLIAAQLTAAWYSALLTKKTDGKEITEELGENTFQEVLDIWGVLCGSISEALQESRRPINQHLQGQLKL